jgi:hypothetical protein
MTLKNKFPKEQVPMTLEKDFTNICYKRNYLKEVIARVDFVSPIEDIKKQLPSSISAT